MLLWTALLVGSQAFGQAAPGSEADQRGEELYQNGKALYDEGAYPASIAAWKAGYELTGRADFLWNIAAAEERMGDLAAARATLDQYRAFATPADREAIDRRIRALEARLAVEGGTVTAPAPQRPPPLRDRPSTSPAGPRRAIGWTLLGSGAAGLALGGVYGFRALSARDEASALCQQADDGLWCPTTADPALAAGQRRALVADLGFGIGGGAVALGGLLVILPVSGRF